MSNQLVVSLPSQDSFLPRASSWEADAEQECYPQGSVYQRIMDDVIDSCQVTFEEDGVNQQTLEDLRKTWQTKLTALHVASFPWEPPPVPQPMVNPTPVPSNVPRPAQVPSSGPPALPLPAQSGGASGVRIKQEPVSSYDNQGLGQTNGIPNYGSTVAQQRAAQNLHQKFGSNANLQINQLQVQAQTAQAGSGPQQSQSLQNIQLPPNKLEQQRRDFANDQKRQLQGRQYQNLQQAQQRPAVNGTQVDGANDWDAMVSQRRAEALSDPAGFHIADATLRQRVDQMSHDMEGGGLMMPLSEQPKLPQVERRKVAPQAAGNGSLATLAAAQPAGAPNVARYDGVDDSDEDNIKDDPDLDNDEDAINSDLDDPDDNVVEEGDENPQQGQIMLCTYDKVQRVKNKWKCTLKDGVLTTGGKEYVFHKAQGEFEW